MTQIIKEKFLLDRKHEQHEENIDNQLELLFIDKKCENCSFNNNLKKILKKDKINLHSVSQ